MKRLFYIKRKRRFFPRIVKIGFYSKGRLRAVAAVLLILALFSSIIIGADMKIRPIVKNAAGNALKNKMTLTVNDAVSRVLSENSIDYSGLVTIEKDNSGAVTSITTNSSKMNLFKSEISKKVSDLLNDNSKLTLHIPLGTLLESEVFSGRGTDVKIDAELFGFAVTDFKSKFESAGINQTHHSLYITVKTSAYAHAGAVRISETVTTDVLVAETVIVGSVPNGYINKES